MDYDAYLNGSSFAPVGVVEASDRQEPGGKDQGVPNVNAGGAGPVAATSGARASTQTIVLVWFILLALLVMSHVVTLSLQR